MSTCCASFRGSWECPRRGGTFPSRGCGRGRAGGWGGSEELSVPVPLSQLREHPRPPPPVGAVALWLFRPGACVGGPHPQGCADPSLQLRAPRSAEVKALIRQPPSCWPLPLLHVLMGTPAPHPA